jgi:hypothetical protein
MNEWTIQIDGRPCTITVADSPAGKRMIRADGRLVAPPQAGPSIDCTFNVGAVRLRLHGEGDALALETVAPVEVAPIEAAAIETEVVRRGDVEDVGALLSSRVRVFLGLGTFLFLVACICSLVTWVFSSGNVLLGIRTATMVAEPSRAVFRAQQEIWVRIAAGMIGEALIGAGLVLGAVLLKRRVAWAPQFIELVIWSVPAMFLLILMATDPLVHGQLRLPNEPPEMVLWYGTFHRISRWILIPACLVAGGLLHYLRRPALEWELKSDDAY